MSRRRRNRKRGGRSEPRAANPRDQHAVPDDWGETETVARPGPGTRIVEEDVLRSAEQSGVDRSGFREGGYRCNRCQFSTKKKGHGGVQALRAHSRRHVNDRRAVRTPLVRRAAVLAVSVVLVLIFMLSDLDRFARLPTVPDDLAGYVPYLFAGVPVLLAIHMWFLVVRFGMTGRRRLARAVDAEVLAGDLLVIATAAAWTSLSAAGIDWWWLVPVGAPLLSALVVAPR